MNLKHWDVKLAEEQLVLDNISLNIAKRQLDYCNVKSPIDGVVSAMSITKGYIISSATSVVRGPTVMTVSDFSHVFVIASVDEADVGG